MLAFARQNAALCGPMRVCTFPEPSAEDAVTDLGNPPVDSVAERNDAVSDLDTLRRALNPRLRPFTLPT
jgi:hypothetical protein